MAKTYSLASGLTLFHADCRDVLRALPDNSIDSIPCDPPYGLQFMGKEWDKLWRDRTDVDKAWRDSHEGTLAARARKLPDYAAMAKGAQIQEAHFEWASEAFRVLKPGGHLAAFSASRTYHRMACAIEDAGFEIRDSLCWLYGSGFPKSHSLRDIGMPERGTALKPAFEPIVLARKPLSEPTVAANVLKWRTGALNIDGCRIPGESTKRDNHGGTGDPTQWRTGNGGDFTSGSDAGRWPANVVTDGSDEVVGMFPVTSSGSWNGKRNTPKTKDVFGAYESHDEQGHAGSTGSAARFFYSAKASKADRAGSKHPTVKPIALMAWLARLITPPGGTCLDPFAGSGTTGAAAVQEGFQCLLVEREQEYVADILARFAAPKIVPDDAN